MLFKSSNIVALLLTICIGLNHTVQQEHSNQSIPIDENLVRYNPNNYSSLAFTGISTIPLMAVIFYFETSIKLKHNWFWNNKLLNIENASNEYEEECVDNSCKLFFYANHTYDGVYALELRSFDDPDMIIYNNSSFIRLNRTVFNDVRPEIKLPETCTSDYTCEWNKQIEIECNAYSNKINNIKLFILSCQNLDDCSSKKFSYNKKMIVNPNASKKIIGDQDPIIKSSVNLSQPNLIICYADNEIRSKYKSVILLPSDIQNGLSYRVTYKGERETDNDTIKDDNVTIKFEYNSLLFDRHDFNKPPKDCNYTISEEKTKYTRTYLLKFDKIRKSCTHNYTFTLARDQVYVGSLRKTIFYHLEVQNHISPTFFEYSTSSSKNIEVKEVNDNLIKIYAAINRTVVLNCNYTGKPFPNITWYKDKHILNTSEKSCSLSKDNTTLAIVLTNTNEKQFSYECTIANRYGSITRQFILAIDNKSGLLQRLGFGLLIILLVLLLVLTGYVIRQKKINNELKEKNIKRMKELDLKDRNWEIPPTNFEINPNSQIGTGSFGEIHLATILNVSKLNISNPDSIEVTDPFLPKLIVAAKVAKDQSIKSISIDLLLQELKILKEIGHHLNLIRLIGCCTSQLKIENTAYIFLEYCENGDLRNWLKKHLSKYNQNDDIKHSLIHKMRIRSLTQLNNSNSDVISFNDQDLNFFCYQICEGMEYLANKHILHCDLAARNILLSKNYECKISDFGLTVESLSTSVPYYKSIKNTKIPVKWTAPEVFKTGRHEANSDVWSFGLTMWEIFELGIKEPYSSIPNREFPQYMIDKIITGLEKPPFPKNGSDEIHRIIERCLTIDTEKRPKFDILTGELENLLSEKHKNFYNLLKENFMKNINELLFNKPTSSNTSDNSSKSVEQNTNLNENGNYMNADKKDNSTKDYSYKTIYF